MMSGLGIRMPEDEIRELICDVDTECLQRVTYDEFITWWLSVVGSGNAQVLHTEAAVDEVLRDEKLGERVVVLMVGFTTCVPCKKFLPTFEKYAEETKKNTRF